MLLKKNFDPVYRAIDDVDELALKVATIAYDKARKYVPVDTGRLKASILKTSKPNANGSRKHFVYTNQVYAKYVEYGSSTNKPRFYMKKAALDAEVAMIVGLTDIKRRLG